MNHERVGFDDCVETYTQMTAELVVRILERKRREQFEKHPEQPEEQLSIHLVCAAYRPLGEGLLAQDAYKIRLKDALSLGPRPRRL